MCLSPLPDFNLRGGKFSELRNIDWSTIQIITITPITSDRLTQPWQSLQPWELSYHIWLLEYMTLSMSFLHNPYGDCPSTCSASSQRGAASIFTTSSNPCLSVPPFPCSFIHTPQASHLNQTPHCTSTQVLVTFIFAPPLWLALPLTGLLDVTAEADPPLPSASQLQDAPAHSHTAHFFPHLGFSSSHWPWQERIKSWLYIVRRSNISHIIWVGSRWEKRTLSIAPCCVGNTFRLASEKVALLKCQQFYCKHFRVYPHLLSDS